MRRELLTVIKVEKQKIYDEIYEDLNDLISVICPIESQDDPVWEKGAVPLSWQYAWPCWRTASIRSWR